MKIVIILSGRGIGCAHASTKMVIPPVPKNAVNNLSSPLSIIVILLYLFFKVTPLLSACNQEDGWFYERKKADPRVNLSTDAEVIP